MTCRGCQRDNDPRRRYCGRCGLNLVPACAKCSFANDVEDRFCGGCGDALLAANGCRIERAVIAAVPAPAAAPATIVLSDELGGLFGAPADDIAPPALPEAGIAQHDLDRLFGVVP